MSRHRLGDSPAAWDVRVAWKTVAVGGRIITTARVLVRRDAWVIVLRDGDRLVPIRRSLGAGEEDAARAVELATESLRR